jgi:hypothetical protein
VQIAHHMTRSYDVLFSISIIVNSTFITCSVAMTPGLRL